MHIFFDGEIFTLQQYGGISLVFDQIAERISNDYPNTEVTRYRWPQQQPELIKQLYPKLGVGHALRLIDRLTLLNAVKKSEPDVYHPTYYRVPRGLSSAVVITIHDMIPELHPEVGGVFNTYIRFAKRRALRRATHVVAVSEKTKEDIVQLTEIDSGKITVIHPAPNPYFRHTESPTNVETGEEDYFLYVGRRDFYKNFLNLLHAYGEWPANSNIRLRCVGGRNQWSASEKSLLRKYNITKRVNLYGHVSESELLDHYRKSLAFVYPSTIEGFGIPPLEAMLCGTPVLISKVAPMTEVVGEAGCYFDPDDPADIREAFDIILNDENRMRLIEKGTKHVQKYTWESTTEQIYELYNQLV